jgi:uncharacterized alkaline shock family protein YloU
MMDRVGPLGKVEIAPEVLEIIAGMAASKVEGVSGMKGGVVGDINQLLGRKNLRQGIQVALNEQTAIQVSIIVEYGYHIPNVGQEVQEQVKSAIEAMTGIVVDQVIVQVEGIRVPQVEKVKDKQEKPNRLK